MRTILLVFFVIFSINHIHPANAGVTLDPDNISPSTFENLVKEAETRDKSFSKVGYYVPGSEIIEFRVIVNPTKEDANDFEWLTDYEKNNLPVSKKVKIDSADIEGILSQKSTYSGQEEYRIIIFFRQRAWDKIHAATERLAKVINRQCVGDKLALIKGKTVVIAPMVCDPITERVVIEIPGGSSHIGSFIENLLLAEEPLEDKRTMAYIEWLEKRVKSVPDDLTSTRILLSLYYENRLLDCEKEYILLESLMLKGSSINEIDIERLHACYKPLQKYDRAIQTFETLAQRDKDLEWIIRGFLADLYYAKGDSEKALSELNRSLVLANSQSLPQSFDYIPEGPEKRKMIDDLNKAKEKIIKSIENRIKEIETGTKAGSSH